jgi:outer membrane protein assembly factor BamB
VALAAPPLARADSWPTAGHDPRRTGQSEVRGPAAAPNPSSVVTGGSLVNMPATIASDGTLFVGTWGLVRDRGSSSPLDWDKMDGRLHAFAPDLAPAWATPFPGDLVPYCYVYAGAPATCPGTPGATTSFYNGTVEGTAALSADETTVYFGRGDGKLYAVEVATGTGVWTFPSYDATDLAHPDGGGEVIGGPLVGADGTIYFATAGAGPHETHAVYAVDAAGIERWRFPSSASSWRGAFLAAPALSPDGTRLYVASAWGPEIGNADPAVRGALLAFDLAAPVGTGDERLLWSLDLTVVTISFWATDLAVGSDGTLFVGGAIPFLGWHATVAAYRDLGASAAPLWPAPVGLAASVVEGLALRDIADQTTRLYVTTGNAYSELGQSYPPGGVLAALDPATGAALWPAPFDPSTSAGGGGFGTMTGIALGADGTIYTGVSGETAGGRVLAVREDGSLLWQLPLDGLLEYAHPVLGPGGELYVGDAGDIRRCYFDLLPVEQGFCPQADDPRVYRLPPLLFADGFASGDLSAWSGSAP